MAYIKCKHVSGYFQPQPGQGHLYYLILCRLEVPRGTRPLYETLNRVEENSGQKSDIFTGLFKESSFHTWTQDNVRRIWNSSWEVHWHIFTVLLYMNSCTTYTWINPYSTLWNISNLHESIASQTMGNPVSWSWLLSKWDIKKNLHANNHAQKLLRFCAKLNDWTAL